MCKNWLLIGLLTISGAGMAQTTETLSANGYGPVKIGMTVAEASKVLRMKLADGDPPNAECYYVYPPKTEIGKEVGFMVRNYRIARIDLPHENNRYKTDSGIQVGDSEQKVRQTYGKNIVVTQHHYGSKGDHYLTYWLTPKHQRGIRFETMGGKVVGIYGGDKSIELVEGCQ